MEASKQKLRSNAVRRPLRRGAHGVSRRSAGVRDALHHRRAEVVCVDIAAGVRDDITRRY